MHAPIKLTSINVKEKEAKIKMINNSKKNDDNINNNNNMFCHLSYIIAGFHMTSLKFKLQTIDPADILL